MGINSSGNMFSLCSVNYGIEKLIVMENLEIGYSKTHSKKVNYLLKRLKIQNIKTHLLKYCNDYGINTAKINPAFTSQQCPVCRSISKATISKSSSQQLDKS